MNYKEETKTALKTKVVVRKINDEDRKVNWRNVYVGCVIKRSSELYTIKTHRMKSEPFMTLNIRIEELKVRYTEALQISKEKKNKI